MADLEQLSQDASVFDVVSYPLVIGNLGLESASAGSSASSSAAAFRPAQVQVRLPMFPMPLVLPAASRFVIGADEDHDSAAAPAPAAAAASVPRVSAKPDGVPDAASKSSQLMPQLMQHYACHDCSKPHDSVAVGQLLRQAMASTEAKVQQEQPHSPLQLRPRPPQLLFLGLDRTPAEAGVAGKDRQHVSVCSTLQLPGCTYALKWVVAHRGLDQLSGHLVLYRKDITAGIW